MVDLRNEAVVHVQKFVEWMREKEKDFVIVGQDSEPLETTRLEVNELETVLAVALSPDREEFLESAERAVKGWRKANTRQIENIGRLGDQVSQARQAMRRWQELGPEIGTDPGIVMQNMAQLRKILGMDR